MDILGLLTGFWIVVYDPQGKGRLKSHADRFILQQTSRTVLTLGGSKEKKKIVFRGVLLTLSERGSGADSENDLSRFGNVYFQHEIVDAQGTVSVFIESKPDCLETITPEMVIIALHSALQQPVSASGLWAKQSLPYPSEQEAQERTARSRVASGLWAKQSLPYPSEQEAQERTARSRVDNAIRYGELSTQQSVARAHLVSLLRARWESSSPWKYQSLWCELCCSPVKWARTCADNCHLDAALITTPIVSKAHQGHITNNTTRAEEEAADMGKAGKCKVPPLPKQAQVKQDLVKKSEGEGIVMTDRLFCAGCTTCEESFTLVRSTKGCPLRITKSNAKFAIDAHLKKNHT
jgi:hypothetical protein